MRTLKSSAYIALFLSFAVSVSAQTDQATGPRFALVIGNGAYQGLSALKNPVNDASDVAAAFKRLGYAVDLLLNADLPAMETASARLAENLAANPQSCGVFYFAGHGVQSQGSNYLVPVGANIPAEAFLKTKALSAQTVLDLMQGAGNKLNLVILDACRDNPFAWSRGLSSRGLSVVGMQPPGSILVFATSAGSVAQDGTGRNGLFTQELLKNLETPGLDLNTMLDRTAAGVQKTSANKQNPAIYKQYFGVAYIGAPPPAPSSPSPAPAALSIGKLQAVSGNVEISLASPGRIAIAGQSLDSGAGLLPIGGLAPGVYAISVTYADGKLENAAVVIEAGKTAKAVFGYAAQSGIQGGTWIDLGDKARCLIDMNRFEDFYNVKDFFATAPGSGALYKAYQGGKLKDSWWIVVQDMPSNLAGHWYFATSYRMDGPNTTVAGQEAVKSINLNGFLIGDIGWLGLPFRFSGNDELQFDGDSNSRIKVSTRKVSIYEDRKGRIFEDCMLLDYSGTESKNAYNGVIVLQRGKGIVFARGAYPGYLEGKAYTCELSEFKTFEKRTITGRIIDNKKRYADPLFGFFPAFHSFGKPIFKPDSEGRFDYSYYGDMLGLFYGVFTKDPWGSLYPAGTADNKFSVIGASAGKNEVVLNLQ